MTRMLLVLLALAACDSPAPPNSSFYEERIDPILRVGCAQQTNGCHIDLDGTATGNLDLSSFDALMRRRDVLAPYGPYPVGLLLLKGGNDVNVSVGTWDVDPISGARFAQITTDIRHNAGSLIAEGSAGYAELKRWIEAGADRNGVPDESLSENIGECVHGVPEFPGFDPSAAPDDAAAFAAFRNDVQPLLHDSCAGSACHGNRFADLFLTCGDDDAELRWNYFVATQHLTTPVSTSSLLRRPLATFRGGTFHEGGNIFDSVDDARYQAMLAWATDYVDRRPELLIPSDPDPGLRFFANRVQPVLVRKGCMFLGCHSVSMFHDLRLRGGDQGVFSPIATIRNYEMSRELLAIESPDPNAGRFVAKNLFPVGGAPGAVGIAHRGGSLFEDFSTGGAINPATVDDCASFDADTGDLDEVPAYCVIARWHAIEREEAAASGEILPEAQVVDGLVWVSRPPGVGGIRDFDTFRGGADLRFATATVDAAGAMTLDASSSLLGSCPLGSGADIRTPAVSWDGARIAFAARQSAAEPLRLWWMNADGSACEPVPDVALGMNEANGVLLHDFDPAFAPDGRLVFASTRGNVDGEVETRGPTRTPASLQPNANLFVREDGGVRQLTFLLDQELAPNFMRDGRMIFTTEKRAEGFHQLSLRRQNLDGGDYHPLFAQRDSVGFPSGTEVVELVGGNQYAFVAGPLDAADGAGAIAVVNRSIGPDQIDRAATDRPYIHSLRLALPGALGVLPGIPAGPTTRGAYRSPAALPTGRVVVSCDQSATDLRAGGYAYALCELEPQTGALREIGGESGQANVEAVAVYGRAQHGVFTSRRAEANGASRLDVVDSGALLHVLDAPLLDTLLFSNTRIGRPIDPAVGGIRFFEQLPPPPGTTSFAELGGDVVRDDFGEVFVSLRDLGFVPALGDGSLRAQVPGGAPLRMQITDGDGTPLMFADGGALSGQRIQREATQLYPGESLNQSFPRRFFNGLCGSCHGSITGRELDLAVLPDILTSASRTAAAETAPVDVR